MIDWVILSKHVYKKLKYACLYIEGFIEFFKNYKTRLHVGEQLE